MRMALSGSRTEFLAGDTLGGDIQYGRSGGCFVSTRRGIMCALLVAAALLLVGLLVFFLAPCPHGGKDASAAAVNGTAGPSMGGAGEGGAASSPALPEGPGSGGGATTETTPPKGAPVDLRLPKEVRPRYYSIWLQPFIGDPAANNFTFKGLVDVEVFCESAGEACGSVSLHARELNVSWDEVSLRLLPAGVSSVEAPGRAGRAIGKKYNASADNAPGSAANASAPAAAATTPAPAAETVAITKHEKSADKDMITFSLAKPMEVGRNYSLEIPFWGNLSTSLSGFYRSHYKERTGTEKWLAVTHFEPTYARRAFPCFDEPAMKARFEMHVARRQNASSISNMPLKSSENIAEQPGWVWDHYPPSPVMSSYLVALVVSELANKSAPVTSPTSPAFDVVARPDLLPTADYALAIGPRILDHYTDYFNISYPLPKVTMAAVPDFAAGAMENWGLVLYRESLMLFNSSISTAQSQQSVASVVAHELAHQWFGNLVTMDWWSDLWLNEGFATYVSYIGVNHVEPTWHMLEKIVTEQMHPVLETDALNSSHPVSVEVQNPAQISEAFDEVSYNKGACLIRMLNHSLTENVFRSGLTSYLNKWTWANANQDDLWASLTEAAGNATGLLPAGASVKAVMDTWTLQKGYPVVTVRRDYKAGSLQLAQRQFKLEGTNGAGAAEDRAPAWYVPVSYATGEDVKRLQDTRPRTWLTPEHNSNGLTVSNVSTPGSDTWLLLNVQQTGYYRVNYDSANWRLLSSLLQTGPLETVPAASRAQLLSDALNLARAGLLNYDTALNLTTYLSRETDAVPWKAFVRAYSFLDDMLRDSREYSNLQAYARRLMSPVAQWLGREARPTDTLPQRQLRATVLARLLRAEEPDLLNWARAQFALWLNASDANPVPVDLRFEVYCAAARYGGEREWAALETRFRASDQLPAERSYLLRALMCTRLPHLITTMLERSLEEGGDIRLQDSMYVWRSIPQNPVASYVAFRYVRQNWDSIYTRYNKVPFVLKEVLRSSVEGLSTELDLQDVLEFFKLHKSQFSVAARTVDQALEKLRLRVHWRTRHRAQLAAWLRQDSATTTAPAAATTPATPATPAASPTAAPAASSDPASASSASPTASSTAATPSG